MNWPCLGRAVKGRGRRSGPAVGGLLGHLRAPKQVSESRSALQEREPDVEVWRFLTLISVVAALLLMCVCGFLRAVPRCTPSNPRATAKVIPSSPNGSWCGRVKAVCLCLEVKSSAGRTETGNVTPKTSHEHRARMKSLQPSPPLLINLLEYTDL